MTSLLQLQLSQLSSFSTGALGLPVLLSGNQEVAVDSGPWRYPRGSLDLSTVLSSQWSPVSAAAPNGSPLCLLCHHSVSGSGSLSPPREKHPSAYQDSFWLEFKHLPLQHPMGCVPCLSRCLLKIRVTSLYLPLTQTRNSNSMAIFSGHTKGPFLQHNLG